MPPEFGNFFEAIPDLIEGAFRILGCLCAVIVALFLLLLALGGTLAWLLVRG